MHTLELYIFTFSCKSNYHSYSISHETHYMHAHTMHSNTDVGSYSALLYLTNSLNSRDWKLQISCDVV